MELITTKSNQSIYGKNKKPESPYFQGKSGKYWPFANLTTFIIKSRQDLIGKPFMKQVSEIGLEEEFHGGITRFQCPGTLAANKSEWV